jgi:hypothetical protein
MNFFFGEFSNFLEQMIIDPKLIIILGDFNFHVDSPNDAAAIKFNDFLETFGLKQYQCCNPSKWPYPRLSDDQK